MALHAQRQGLDALQDLESGHRRHASAEIANALAPRAQQERGSRRFLGEYHVVKARVRLGQRRELAGAGTRPVPIEPAAVDQQPADHHAVTGQKLGRRVVDQVRAVFERPHQIRRGERRIDQQRQPVIVRQRRDTRHVEHVEPGVAERLAEQQPRFRTDRRAPGVQRRADRRTLSRCRSAAACSRADCASRRTAHARRRCASLRRAALRWQDAAPPGRWPPRWRRRRLRARQCAPRGRRRSDWRCVNRYSRRAPC